MPPAISDEESVSSDDGVIIASRKPVAEDADAEDEPEEQEGDEKEEEEDEYVVERICNHRWDAGANDFKYEVKWAGWEKKSDRTWEPEENLEGAIDILDQYFKKIGGRPEPGGKKNKRRRSEIDSATPEVKGSGRRGKKGKLDTDEGTPITSTRAKPKWEPPKGSWETTIMAIETISEDMNAKTGERELMGFVAWNEGGHQSRHPLKTLRQKCPQKLLDYYEQHLVFKTTDTQEAEPEGAPEAEMYEIKDTQMANGDGDAESGA